MYKIQTDALTSIYALSSHTKRTKLLCLHIVDPGVLEFAAHKFAALLPRNHCNQLVPCVWVSLKSKLLELVLQRLVRQTIVDYAQPKIE